MADSTALATLTALDVAIDVTRRTLRPFGEIDMATAPMLLQSADTLMLAAVGDVTIDLASVTFADSALLHALLDIRDSLRIHGAGLWLVNEAACVRRLFVASEFRTVFAA